MSLFRLVIFLFQADIVNSFVLSQVIEVINLLQLAALITGSKKQNKVRAAL